MKNIFGIVTLALLTACTSCGSAELKTNETAGPVDPYPFATWEECSQVAGDNPCNFTLKDQHDEEVSLYDFYGSTIVLDLSAMWCGPCRAAAMDVQATVERFAGKDVRYITVLIDNLQGTEPTLNDVQSWADMYGITTEPVLQGSRALLNGHPTQGWPLSSWPTFILITSEMEVFVFQSGYNQQLLDILIEDTIAHTQQ